MDRKSITILVLSVILLIAWTPIVNHFYPPPPQSTNDLSSATSPMGSDSNAVATAATTASTSTTNVSAALPLPADTPETTETLETDDAIYTFTSLRGGLKLAELKHYERNVSGKKATRDTNVLASVNTKAPLPAMALLGGKGLEGNGVYKLSKSGNTVRAEMPLQNGLYIIKEFTPGTNYILHAKVRIENRSGTIMRLPEQTVLFGTGTPQTAHDSEMNMGLMWYDGNKDHTVASSWFANKFLGCGPSKQPRTEYKDGNGDVVWAAVHNQFFAMAAVPKEKAPTFIARRIELPPPTEEEKAIDPRAIDKLYGYEAGFVYPEKVLGANGAVEHEYDLFAGPREYHTLAALAASYGNNLDLVMSFGGFFGFFAKALLLIMNTLASWGVSYGWAIVIITVTIKVIFWPLTRASTISAKRMAALGPEIKKIQEKHKDDPQKAAAKQMELWREHKVNPMGSCIPMVVQIPVFFGLFRMLRTAIELRGAGFLWIADLSQPDTAFIIPGLGWLPFVGIPGHGFPINPMPILMGITMFFQTRMTPPSPTMDPVQQKIMRYMPMMFLLFLYNFSAGLTVYWTINNLLTILQTKLTNATIKDVAIKPGAPVAAAPVKPRKK